MFEPQEFVAQGDTVVVLGREAGRVKSTGRTANIEAVFGGAQSASA